MKHIISFTLAIMMLSGLPFRAQPSSSEGPIRMVLPPGIEPRSCQLRYFLVGSFGGYGGFARPKLNASEFEIETLHEGAGVKSLKAALYCPGYQLQTITFDALPDVVDRNLQLNPNPLGTVRLLGEVRGLTSQNAQVFHVDVDYTPSWLCESFRLADCFLAGWTVASVNLDANGRFSVTLPDFARDTVIGGYKNPGEFTFHIRDQKTGNRLFELKPAGNQSPVRGVPVANGYPGVQAFDAELANRFSRVRVSIAALSDTAS
jgi:hypothetical protein